MTFVLKPVKELYKFDTNCEMEGVQLIFTVQICVLFGVYNICVLFFLVHKICHALYTLKSTPSQKAQPEETIYS